MPKKKNPSRKSTKLPITIADSIDDNGSKNTSKNIKSEFAISKEDQIKYNKEYQESLKNLVIDQSERPEDEIKSESSLWVDVYAPKTLEEYLSDNSDLQSAVDWFEKFHYKKGVIPRYLLITGKPGIGKTTLAHLIFKKYKY